jgi:hypothetical protein
MTCATSLRPEREADAARHGQAHQVAHFQHRLADLCVQLREKLVDGAAHHHLDQFGFIDLADQPRAHILPIAQHGHAVRQREDFLHTVADIDDAHAAFAQQPHNLEQALHIRLGERGSRLVHDQNFRVLAQRLGDFDALPVAHRH